MPTIITDEEQLRKVSPDDSVILVRNARYRVICSKQQQKGETGTLRQLAENRGWIVEQVKGVASTWLEKILDK